LTGVTRALLDQPIWSALTSSHASLAIGIHARRYPSDIEPFIAWPEADPAAAAEAADLVAPDEVVVTMQAFAPRPLAGLMLVGEAAGVQMIATGKAPSCGPGHDIIALHQSDVVQMIALAGLTRPGPFCARTHILAQFWGVRDEGQLVAMAGERLRFAGHSEVSGVCVHPAARGRGLARRLSLHVMECIRQRGETPLLHAYADNRPALRLYEELGFTPRSAMHVQQFRRT